MPSRKTIKRRIGSVGTTKQIVKAMDMVAATKLQKTKHRLIAARPLVQAAEHTMARLATCARAALDPLFQHREVNSTAYVVITSDRGYCGGYNSNISAHALAHMNEGRSEEILAMGLRGRARSGRRL